MPDPQERLFPLPAAEIEALEREESARSGASVTGTLAELAAISLLLRRGAKVAVPVVDDDGVDLIVNYRHLCQVKASSRPQASKGGRPASNAWVFHSGGTRGRYNSGGLVRTAPPATAQFFLCFAIPVEVWWVIPREALHEAGMSPRAYGFSVVLEPTARTLKYSSLSQYRDAWHLLD